MASRLLLLWMLLCIRSLVFGYTLRNQRGVSGPIPIEEYIKNFGYPVEKHAINTSDGYILTYHRIPGGKGSDGKRSGSPVLLQHGLLCASPVWVMSPESLAYLLADAGFDVWLGNARGNTYSRKHIIYNPDTDGEFWDYSWHEMGYYDLPASIDYILRTTGRRQLFYVGHSMGTTMYFVLGATRPHYMNKIKAAVMLAPVATPFHVHHEGFLTIVQPILNWLLRRSYEVLPLSQKTAWFDNHVCSNPLLQVFCRDLIFSFCGYDESQLNRTLLPTILEYLPAGASHKELTHYTQIGIEEHAFRQFDYGYKGNIWKYGTPIPPAYNLSLVSSPLYMYYSDNDWAAVPQDVLYAAKLLPNVQRLYKVPYEKFNHIDFMWAIDAKTLLFNDIIASLNSLLVADAPNILLT